MRETYLQRNWVPLLLGAAAVGLTVLSIVGLSALLVDDEEEHAHVHDHDHERLESFRMDGEHGPLIEGLRESLEELEALSDDLREDLREDLGEWRVGPTLGVTVEASGDRLLVERVLPGSAAERAGIREGDELRAIAGQRVTSVEDVRAALADVGDADAYPVEVRRDGRRLTLDVPAVPARAAGGWRPFPGADGPDGGAPPQLEDLLEGLFGGATPGGGFGGGFGSGGALDGALEQALSALLSDPEMLEALLERFAEGLFMDPFAGGEQRPAIPVPVQPPKQRPPAPGVPATPPAVAPAPERPPVQLVPEAYFGVIAALDATSVTLTGDLGAITLGLSPQTETVGVGPPRVGGLAAVAVVDGLVVQLLVIA